MYYHTMRKSTKGKQTSRKPKAKTGKGRASGQRVGKSRADKANNQRNRILRKAPKPQMIITPDGHCLRPEVGKA